MGASKTKVPGQAGTLTAPQPSVGKESKTPPELDSRIPPSGYVTEPTALVNLAKRVTPTMKPVITANVPGQAMSPRPSRVLAGKESVVLAIE